MRSGMYAPSTAARARLLSPRGPRLSSRRSSGCRCLDVATFAVSFRLGEGAGRGDLAHDLGHLVERVVRGRELAGYPSPVEDDDPIGHRVDVEDVVVDEDRGLAGLPDAADESK